jgi:L-lysine exporter family protein LysE/ArgO
LSAVSSSAALSALTTGFGLSLGLIVAIGAQNAFVLRQGLRREHVGAIVLFCAVADALLMAAGVFGMAQALQAMPALATGLTVFGALFLLAYGIKALWRARQSQALSAAGASNRTSLNSLTSLTSALAQTAAFTLLNPHVYLDTVLLVGAIGAQQGDARGWFVGGAALASAAWFFSLGYGARWLAPWFAKPRAWQVLDVLIGVTMLALALMLGLRLI